MPRKRSSTSAASPTTTTTTTAAATTARRASVDASIAALASATDPTARRRDAAAADDEGAATKARDNVSLSREKTSAAASSSSTKRTSNALAASSRSRTVGSRSNPSRRGTTSSPDVVLLPASADEPDLPRPVMATSAPDMRLRFLPPNTKGQLISKWHMVKRKLGAASFLTESLTGDFPTTDDSDGTASFVRCNSTAYGPSVPDDEAPSVDDVIVENNLPHHLWGPEGTVFSESGAADANHPARTGTGTGTGTHAKEVAHQGSTAAAAAGGAILATSSAAGSIRHTDPQTLAERFVAFWRWRVFAALEHFFTPHYHTQEAEEAYQREVWYTTKLLSFWSACFVVLIWILATSLLRRPFSTWYTIEMYALAPLFVVPLPVFVLFNLPRRVPWLWQCWLFCATWIFPFGIIIEMHTCHAFDRMSTCASRNYGNLLFYAAALPVLAIFSLNASRAYVAVGCIAYLIFTAAVILPFSTDYVRFLVNIFIFQAFILYIGFNRDMAERRIWTLRAELKVQYRGKQKAQVAERKAADSKRRLTQYVFHEIRVPLNSALLAVQNLEAVDAIRAGSTHEIEFTALSGSLNMMSQVLNDVLDFNRMERGGFVSVARPFSLHSLIRALSISAAIDAKMSGLGFELELDDRIDLVARRAAGAPPSPKRGTHAIDEEDEDPADGVVLGDEMRLRQVVTNLVSNAIKFTPAGGKITIRSQLIFPLSMAGEDSRPQQPPRDDDDEVDLVVDLEKGDEALEEKREDDLAVPDEKDDVASRLSVARLQAHNDSMLDPKLRGLPDRLVARIEVTDTGAGIKARDMVDQRLFSPYVQTEIGRSQGGKGTGLGLALVRQIVSLSGGRLGVRSRWGHGSTFWVEIPLGIGPRVYSTAPMPPLNSLPRIKRAAEVGRTSTLASSLPSKADLVSSPMSERSEMNYISSLGGGFVGGSDTSDTKRSSSEDPLARPRPSRAPSSATTSSQEPSPSPGNSALLKGDARPPGPLSPPPADVQTSTTGDLAPVGTHAQAAMSAPAALDKQPSSSPRPRRSGQENDWLDGGRALQVGSGPLELADGPLSVLVVDDDLLTRRLMGRMMERLGCKPVDMAENGQLALDMIMSDVHGRRASDAGSMLPNFDVVFLDNQMPVCSGIEAVKHLRARSRRDLIVGVTANALKSDQEQYIDAGASFVLTKPVLEADLRRMLVIADRQRAQRLRGFASPEMPSSRRPSVPDR